MKSLLAKNLRYLRDKSNYKLQDIAEKTKYSSHSTVANWEKEDNNSEPSSNTLIILSSLYGVDIDSMITKDLCELEKESREMMNTPIEYKRDIDKYSKFNKALIKKTPLSEPSGPHLDPVEELKSAYHRMLLETYIDSGFSPDTISGLMSVINEIDELLSKDPHQHEYNISSNSDNDVITDLNDVISALKGSIEK